MAFDSPIGYTSHYHFPKYALGANPGADALNESLIEAIDTKIYEATQQNSIANLGVGGAADSSYKLKVYGDEWITGNSKVDGYSAIGGVVDTNFRQKIYGSQKITGNITVDGDIYIGGNINRVNVVDLDINDHAIRLNKNGDNTTALDGGVEMLGATNALIGSIKYNGSSWISDINYDLATGKTYKIAGTDVLSNTTLGTTIVNSSLTKVGDVITGKWKATVIDGTYLNYNTTNLKVTSNQINAIQDIATTSSPTFTNITLSGKIDQQGTANSEFGSISLLPKQSYTGNIGAINKKWLTLHAAELWVETLVAQNTIATIGGRILVGPTTTLTQDCNSSVNYIHVKHNEMNPGDIVYMEANGSVEFMRIDYGPEAETGGFYYFVTRNLDGTGANNWNAGDALFNTGYIGEGFIDLYSIRGIKNSQQSGPTIVGNVRNSTTYNDWSEHWAIGNLNGLYGYTNNTYGVGLGKYSANASYLLADATNGIQIKKGSTTLAQWDVNGNILVGETGTGKCNVYISAGVVQLRNNVTALITLNADGSGNFAGDITSTAIITGGTFRTAATNQRIVLDYTNYLTFYHDNTISAAFHTTGASNAYGAVIQLDGNFTATGEVIGNDVVATLGYMNSVNGYRVNGNAATGAFLRGNGTNFVSSTIQVADLPTHTHNYNTNLGVTSVGAGLDITSGILNNSNPFPGFGTSHSTVAYGDHSGFNFNNVESITIGTIDNSNGYFTISAGKNFIKVTPSAANYSVTVYNLTDKTPVWITNVGSYPIKIDGVILQPGRSMVEMYDSASSIIRHITERNSCEWLGYGSTANRPSASYHPDGGMYWDTDISKLVIIVDGAWQVEY